MEIRRWLYCVAVNCVLLCYVVAKPFSLNKLIESESNQKEVIHTTLSPNIAKQSYKASKVIESEPAAERFSLNRGLKPLNRIAKKFKGPGTKLNLIPLGKRISPLKYRKTFLIKSPLKPKRVKNSLKTRQKRKNQSIKQEIDGNAILDKKYVPLLRSLGMLFDNILGADSGESIEKTKRKKRLRYYADGDDDVSCKCPRQREFNTEFDSEEETATFSETLPPEVAVTTEAATKTTNNPSPSHLRSFRQHKNLPLLLSRNTSGAWRNNHGISQRGRTTHNGSTERDISGNIRDSKHNSKRRQEQSYAESDEEHTVSDSRNSPSSVGTQEAGRREYRREYRNNTEIYEKDAISQGETENLEGGEDTTQYNGAHKLKTARNKAKSGKLLSKSVRREGGFLSKDKVIDFAESVQSKEKYEENVISIAHDSSGSERFSDRDGPHSSEDKKVNSRPETLIYKIPKENKRYATNPGKATETKGLITNFTLSEPDDDDDESDQSISNDRSEEPNTDKTTSTETRVTNTSSGTGLENQVEQPDISRKSKDEILVANSAEVKHTKYKEDKNGSIEHRNSVNHLNTNKKYSARKQTAKSDTVHNLFEIAKSQYLSKPTTKNRGPVVTIIDGYSVTRHKNGENKLAEKAIHIRP